MRGLFFIFFFITVAFLSGGIFIFRGGFHPVKKVPTSHLKIVCTIGVITDVVKHLAGDTAQVVGLMGPGVDPHLYRAREGDIHKLAKADVIFFNGLHLEGKMGDVLRSMKRSISSVPVADVVPRNKLIEADFDQMYDPHVWHDVSLWLSVVERIKEVLIEVDPKNKTKYQETAKDYKQQLTNLDEYVLEKASSLPKEKRILVTAHDAFNYFGKRYGFEVIGLQGMSTDSEIGAKDIKNLSNFIVENKVPVIFVESSIPQRNIEAVQKAVSFRGGHVKIGPELFSDALGDPETLAGTYHGMIKHNIDAIVSALGEAE